MIEVPRRILNDPEAALSREWLIANGIGGYASSTVSGANTRRYHGLLVSAFPPPLERQVLLAKIDEEATVGGESYPFGVNEYHDGTIHPEGFQHLDSFRLELGIPTWEISLGGVRIVKQVWMEYGKNVVYVLYRLAGPSASAVTLRIRPFCTFRGYHHDGEHGRDLEYLAVERDGRLIVESGHTPYSLRMLAPGGSFEADEDWHRDYLYRIERERGFDCLEDLYTPGVFTARLTPDKPVGLAATSDHSLDDVDFEDALKREVKRRKSLVSGERNSLRRTLLLAADQFVVTPSNGIRALPHQSSTPSLQVLAGYHWFTDWGRDTMISLPGLLLSTGRLAEAREILLRYMDWANGGMLPNRFTDEGSVEYNTADATLWYFQALSLYVTASGDREIIPALYPRLCEIIDWHLRGTRFGIRADDDGLLHAGRTGSQVTWMDACVDDCPITPRIGKPVEINALWFNALSLMAAWVDEIGRPAGDFQSSADKCKASFRRKFWYPDGGYLYDVIDGPDGNDHSIRPNQIIAASLPYSALSARQRKSVVDVVERHLLTPLGLRTLSPENPAYSGKYEGGPKERDTIYHQGTVWPWLLGSFADAHYRVYRDKKRIAGLLAPFRRELREAGLGNISEIYDGDSPHDPRGCIAQAWSIAEILRISTNLPSLR